MKEQLTKQLVLFHLDFTKYFQTNSSEVGLGVVLFQEVDRQEHPVLYLSHKLFPRET